jgi:hypothetical protein
LDDGGLGEPGLAVLGVADDAVDLAGVEEGCAVVAAYVDGFGLSGWSCAVEEPGEVGEACSDAGAGGCGAVPVDGVVEGLECFAEVAVEVAVGGGWAGDELEAAGEGVGEGAASGVVADGAGVGLGVGGAGVVLGGVGDEVGDQACGVAGFLGEER